MAAVRVYCAGPLFNQGERDEMAAIADRLVAAGFDVYLPHRDGMEFRLILEVLIERGFERTMAAQFLHEAIFSLDVYQVVIACGALVWDMNGRTPDEGAVSEAAIAWTLGKPMVAFQDDVRSLIAGRMNPLLAGLVDFTKVGTMAEIVPALQEVLAEQPPPVLTLETLPAAVQQTCRNGAALWDAMQQEQAFCENNRIADCVIQLFAPEGAARFAPSQRTL